MYQDLSPSVDFEQGYILNIDKPYGWTSTDVVRKVKGMLRQLGHHKIKIGHSGTLDPLATGVLLICIGKATKRVDELQAQPKGYRATITLGSTTPSFDLEHPVDFTFPYEHITEQAVQDALKSFEGEILQTPPVYSAKRIDGQRAYDMARSGDTEVKMRDALVNIYSIRLVEFRLPEIVIDVECSKGTYIRSLARDIGLKLNSGGHLSELVRTKSGDFKVEDSLTLDKIKNLLNIKE